jgi:trehalose-6-phosphate synthase
VRDGRFCGYIIAVYDHEPFAHIITAETLFSDIRTVLRSNGSQKDPQILRVATAADVKELSGHLGGPGSVVNVAGEGTDTIELDSTKISKGWLEEFTYYLTWTLSSSFQNFFAHIIELIYWIVLHYQPQANTADESPACSVGTEQGRFGSSYTIDSITFVSSIE